jgi:hypothetical protein
VKHLAAQLSVADPACLKRYLNRPASHREHAGEIQRRLGYRDFNDLSERFRLLRWLYTRAWLSAERPTVLFDLTTARLIERKILLPGVTVLTRLIARVRDRASSRLWRVLAALPNADQRTGLEALLVVRDGDRVSPLDRLRRAPTRISSPAMVDALNRLTELRSFGVNHLDMARLPSARVKALARYAARQRGRLVSRACHWNAASPRWSPSHMFSRPWPRMMRLTCSIN